MARDAGGYLSSSNRREENRVYIGIGTLLLIIILIILLT